MLMLMNLNASVISKFDTSKRLKGCLKPFFKKFENKLPGEGGEYGGKTVLSSGYLRSKNMSTVSEEVL